MARHQNGRARAAECLGRRLGQRIERRLQRHRLSERRGDPVKAALHAGLARVLLEALGVPQRECRKVREGLQELALGAGKPPGALARADPEDALDLPGPAHRRDDCAVESLVRRVRDGLGNLLVVVGESGAAARDRPPGETAIRRELEADQLLRQAVHGGAAKNVSLGVEQEAVDRFGLEEPGNLVDEPLQDGVELELARHDLRRLEQRALLAEPPLVLREQAGDVDRERDLVGDRLRQRDVPLRPRQRLGAMEAEHAEHAIEGDNRRGERGPAPEALEGVMCAQVLELGGGVDVGDRYGPLLARGEVRNGESLGVVADRLEPFGPPLRPHRQDLSGLPQAQEATRRAERAAGLGDGHARQLVEIARRPDATRDRRHEPLPGEGLVERDGRTHAVECDGGLPRDRLHEAELLRREHAPLGRGRDDENADHALIDRQRDEGGAFRSGRFREALAHERRRLDVEDEDRRRLEVRAGDSRRLVAQVDPHRPPTSRCRRRRSGRRGRVPRGRPPRSARARRTGCRAGSRSRPAAPGPPRSGRACARVSARGSQRSRAPRSRSETSSSASRARTVPIRTFFRSRPRNRNASAGTTAIKHAANAGQGCVADGRAVVEHDGAQDRGRDPDGRKDRGERQVGGGDPFALAPERHGERGRDVEIRRRHNEQGDRVEVDSLVLRAHWAFRMIRSRAGCVEENPLSEGQTCSVRLGKMGRTAYWKGVLGGIPSPHWAMRAAEPCTWP